MTEKWTKGPWLPINHNKDETTVTGSGRVVATVYHASDNYEANTYLIAAAPEMYDALNRILRAHDSQNNGAVMGEAVLCGMFAAMARSVLAKARGEGRA